jgi:hypothetical protein
VDNARFSRTERGRSDLRRESPQNFLTGQVAWAEARNGIGGPVVASFDATRALPTSASAPTTYTAPTGEVWTLTGSAAWSYDTVLDPGVYWIAGALQGAATIQPTFSIGDGFPYCGADNTGVARLASTNHGQAFTGAAGSGPLPADLSAIAAAGSSQMYRHFLRAA